MAELSGNTCEIVTLLPLGVICNTVNASTPITTNGSIYLNITGGTAPYSVTWSNGGQGQSLINLKSGDYTANIVDYYGDYSATTTCTVNYDTFNLDKFEDCSNSGIYVYYKSQEPSIFTSGKIYELNGRGGCWTSSGTTLWAGETYVDSFAIINGGPYDDCDSCLPEPTPTPVYPQYICLSKNSSPYTQYTFESGSTIYNGYPVWEETGSTGYKMVYIITNSSWIVSGWTGGILTTATPISTPPPLGTWITLGSSESWTAVSGNCTNSPISITLRISNPSCSATNDGQIIVSAIGGVPPYTYSLDGSFYQNSSTFNGLAAGSGTLFVKDSVGTIQTQTYTLTNQSSVRVYNLGLGPSSSETTIVNSLTEEVKKRSYGIDFSSSFTSNLPVVPDIITYQVGVSYTIQLRGSNTGTQRVPSFTTGVTVTSTGGYSVTSTSEYYGNVTSIVTIGSQTQPQSAITYNKIYNVTYNPANKISGEKFDLEITNGGEVYTGGATELPQSVNSRVRIEFSKVKLTNTNLCSSIGTTFNSTSNQIQISISESKIL